MSKKVYTDFTRKVNRHNSLLFDRQIFKGIVNKIMHLLISYFNLGEIYNIFHFRLIKIQINISTKKLKVYTYNKKKFFFCLKRFISRAR